MRCSMGNRHPLLLAVGQLYGTCRHPLQPRLVQQIQCLARRSERGIVKAGSPGAIIGSVLFPKRRTKSMLCQVITTHSAPERQLAAMLHPDDISVQFFCSKSAIAHTLSEQPSMRKICLTVSVQLPIVAPRCPPSGRQRYNVVRCPSG